MLLIKVVAIKFAVPAQALSQHAQAAKYLPSILFIKIRNALIHVVRGTISIRLISDVESAVILVRNASVLVMISAFHVLLAILIKMEFAHLTVQKILFKIN
jgi:hypothetical protein